MKPLTLKDYDIIKPYLQKADYEGYNSNYVTMMMWNHEYHIEYEIHDHYCVMMHNYKGHRFFAMPFTTEEYYKEAIDYMLSYSRDHGFPFMIDCAIAPFVEKIKKIYGKQFLYERTRDFDDYIYDKNMLMTLSGKKMQKRRNHYNAFLKEYPQHVYRPLTIEKDYDLIIDCLTKWETDKENSESLMSEVYGIMYMLSSNHNLGFKMGGIFIEEELKAFIMASPLTHQTIQIHVEKADKSIRGLYPAIQKEFLEHEYPESLFVNREEDMGLENLRISKTQLHPCKMVEKYRVHENKTSVEKASENDKQEVKRLWLERFEDETKESTEFYFNACYKTDNTYVLRFQNKILSALQIVPFSVEGKTEAYFVLGVSTSQAFEGQGCMKKLLMNVLHLYEGKCIYLQAYHPDIYRPFGFMDSHYHQVVVVDQESYKAIKPAEALNDNKQLLSLYESFTSHYHSYRNRTAQYYAIYLLPRCIAFDDKVMSFYLNGQVIGYAIYHEDEKQVYVNELIYTNDSLDAIISSLCVMNDKTLVVECDLNASISGDKHKILTMMCNQNSDIPMDMRYINEIY